VASDADVIPLHGPQQAAATSEPAVPFPLADPPTERNRSLARGRRHGTLPRRGWLVRRALLAADLIGLGVAFALTLLLRDGDAPHDKVPVATEVLLFVATLPLWPVVAKLHGLYDGDEERADNSTVDDVVGVFHLVTIGAWLLVVACLPTGIADSELPKVVTLWALAIALVPLARALARGMCRRSSAYIQNTVIVGAGDVGQLVARKLHRHPEYGLNVVGFFDLDPRERRRDLPEHMTILGAPHELPAILRELEVERVIVSFSGDTMQETLALVRTLRDLNVQIDLVPRLFELLGPRAGIHTVEGLALIGLPPVRLGPSSRLLKRTIDVVCAGVLLTVLAPLLAFVAWRVRRDSPGPALFRQTRLACQMREFTAFKFRTMHVGTDDTAHRAYIGRSMSPWTGDPGGVCKLEREDAITRCGRWLRRTSLDELPQLLNVLRGDMSLVGPRPCIPYELEHFLPHHYERFLVPQGMTGLWQVTARASSTFGEALDMDVAYARGWSLGLDLRLLLRTPLELLRQRSRTL
jgi:exopolysaccharide biosynthesis polyprenyl glycosylphosphotransferase